MELRDYTGHGAAGLAELVRAGEVTAREVEETARRAIEAVESALHATVGDLLEPADGGFGDGPLAGVPFARKDVAPHLKGQIVQYGSRWTGDGLRVAHDSYLGQRFRAAGLRVIARSRSPEFAFNATTEPKAHGPTHNPWDVTRSAGGSSGGAAALVAARALPIAHATDAAGSIRIPSSLCGVVGMKPTRSRISIAPNVWESVHGLAHDFVIARTLRDVAAALDALHGPVPGDKYLILPPATWRSSAQTLVGFESVGRRTPGRAAPSRPSAAPRSRRPPRPWMPPGMTWRKARPPLMLSSSKGRC